jgi:hypothetical protein
LPSGHGFDVTAQIRFTSTRLHFGGCRVWMICPRCNGRARVMFAGYGKIGCRRCLRVRYRSQGADAKDRAHLAIAKIERRLITRRGRFYKPKGMLWRTFHRLCDRYDHHDAVLNAGLVRAVQRTRASIWAGMISGELGASDCLKGRSEGNQNAA